MCADHLERGERGPRGPAGEDGEMGERGPRGIQGADGDGEERRRGMVELVRVTTRMAGQLESLCPQMEEMYDIIKGKGREPGIVDDVRDLKEWRAASMARVVFVAKWAAGIAASVITAALIVYLAL